MVLEVDNSRGHDTVDTDQLCVSDQRNKVLLYNMVLWYFIFPLYNETFFSSIHTTPVTDVKQNSWNAIPIHVRLSILMTLPFFSFVEQKFLEKLISKCRY